MVNLSLPTDKQSLFSDLRQLLAIAGITVGATGTWTGWRGIVSMVGGAALLIVEHYVGDPSTGTGTPAPPSTGGTLT
jgi:hypothetical protein